MVIPSPNIAKAFNPNDLSSMISSEVWRSLQPNYATRQDLQPDSLSLWDIEEIAEAALQLSASIPNVTDEQNDLDTFTQIACGTLELIGTGDSKSCYRLRTELGSLAVQVLSHDENLGLTIPESRYLTGVRAGPTQQVWEYSDARTYIVLPYTNDIGVRLQEDAGVPYADSPISLIPGPKWLARNRALHRIKSEKKPETRDMHYTQGELGQGRHYLKKNGHTLPLVIDIPVVERGHFQS